MPRKSLKEMLESLPDATVRIWFCLNERHRKRLPVSVEWIDGVAHCATPGCPLTSNSPKRVQQRRDAGWRKPEGAKSVTRSTQWGNPYRLTTKREWMYPPLTVVHTRHGHPTGPAFGGFSDEDAATRFAVDLFRRSLLAGLSRDPAAREYVLGPLVGHDLMCFCPVSRPCHADVLLELAARYERDLAAVG